MITIKDFKEIVKGLPDDTVIFTFDDKGFPHPVKNIVINDYLVNLVDEKKQKVVVIK